MPTEEQVRRWEALEILTKRDDEYNYLINRVPLDRDHEEWLIKTRASGTFANQTATESSVSTSLANESASINKENYAHVAFSSNKKILQAEKKYAYVNLHSTLDGQWYGVIATIDTGSDENWISQDIVDRLRLEVTNGLVTKWRGFNGATVASDSTVRATWCNRGAGISYASVFRVIPNAPFDILFGRNLLASGEVSWADASTLGSVLCHVPPPKGNEEVRHIHDNQIRNNQQTRQAESNYGPVQDDPSASVGIDPPYTTRDSRNPASRQQPPQESRSGKDKKKSKDCTVL